ncbi:MAG: hypothetical protein ACRD15_01825 [Vicinamibacterales bacterium]
MKTPVLTAVWLSLALPMQPSSPASQTQTPERPTCVPIAQRVREVGCWIIVDEPVGRVSPEPVFWHLDTFPTRAAAEAAKRPGAAVIEALGKIWLMTIANADFRAGSDDHVAHIGPLPASSTIDYSATYMEAVFTPGMESSTHTHSGPEAWYTMTGETCLETPDGRMVGRAGGPPVIVPAGPPMHLTATGNSTRRAIVLILHDRSQPPTTVTHAWTPKGLCQAR